MPTVVLIRRILWRLLGYRRAITKRLSARSQKSCFWYGRVLQEAQPAMLIEAFIVRYFGRFTKRDDNQSSRAGQAAAHY